jgi:beta-lactamase class A
MLRAFALLALPLAAQNDAALDARVRAATSGFPGIVSLHAKNLATGREFALRADEPVRTASTIKLPILCALAAEIEAGRLKWTDETELTADDIVYGSGVLREFSPGTRHRIRDLANLMIVVSDNTATNLILDRIGADAVNARMTAWGFPQTKALRKILGDGNRLKPRATGHSKEGLLPEYRRYGIGVSTPREMTRLLEKLHRGEIVSAAASKDILETLKRQQYKDSIGRRLPEDWVASKSGALDALRADVGIVYHPKAPIALALTVDGMPGTDYGPGNAGQRLLASLARLLVDSLAD